MAKNETQKAAPPSPATAVAVAASTAVAVADNIDFSADANAGMEGATSESFAIPFLGVLQKGSPQVDEAGPGPLVEGAKAGMLFENVTSKLYDGKTGVIVVPCAYRRVFLRWGPRSGEGSGLKGELLPEEVAALRARGDIKELDNKLFFPLADGTVNDKKCDRVNDTRNHYVLIVDPETGAWTNALISLASTQIKKSKALMSLIASVKLKGPSGLYTPPSFANMIRVTTVPESNDKGNWYGIKFDGAGLVQSSEIYAAAKAFHASVIKGEVTAKYEEPVGGEAGPGEGF